MRKVLCAAIVIFTLLLGCAIGYAGGIFLIYLGNATLAVVHGPIIPDHTAVGFITAGGILGMISGAILIIHLPEAASSTCP